MISIFRGWWRSCDRSAQEGHWPLSVLQCNRFASITLSSKNHLQCLYSKPLNVVYWFKEFWFLFMKQYHLYCKQWIHCLNQTCYYLAAIKQNEYNQCIYCWTPPGEQNNSQYCKLQTHTICSKLWLPHCFRCVKNFKWNEKVFVKMLDIKCIRKQKCRCLLPVTFG